MPQTTNLPNPKETDKKKKKKKKTKPSLKNLVENNRFIFGCSVVLAFVLWCLVSVYASPVEERTITNVPVTIDLTDSTPERLGLQPFGETEFFVDVTIRGPKYQVSENMFTADSIRVTANVNYVDTAGQKELGLRYEILDTNSDVQVVSMSRESVSVYFDTLKEAVFTLEPDVLFPDGVDRWVYPAYRLLLPQESLAGAAGIAFEIRRLMPGKIIFSRVNARWDGLLTGEGFQPPETEWQERRVLFHSGFEPERIKELEIGFNPAEKKFSWMLRNIRIFYTH